MGRYQWGLFVLCGMGWVADNLWLQVHQEVSFGTIFEPNGLIMHRVLPSL